METCVKSLPCQNDILAWKPTGSYIICSPPVENTDRDILIHVKDRSTFDYACQKDGWKFCGKEYAEAKGSFVALRKGIFNLILTEDESFYWLFSQATDLAKKLNLKEKQQRIDLFHYIIECQI